MEIFLSHSARDRSIAEALQGLFANVFGTENIQVTFSSDQRPGGGIAPGEQWLPWITRHIKRAGKTYVLLTPNSMGKPWILWESGAAAGVALATSRRIPVVPVTFGISDTDIPSPFHATQIVQGDTRDGIIRLLHDINDRLDQHVPSGPFDATVKINVPRFLNKVKTALAESPPVERLLASVPNSFSARELGGFWVTSFSFGSKYHADIAEVSAESDRRVRVKNDVPSPRTEGHDPPFCNLIEAELANRHLLGHWKNLSDTRYFGSIHLAVLSGGKVMAGYYTSFSSDVKVSIGPWKWVRLDSNSLTLADLTRVKLRKPDEIHSILIGHSHSGRTIALRDVVEGN